MLDSQPKMLFILIIHSMKYHHFHWKSLMTYFMVGIYWEICWDCISNEIVIIDSIVKMATRFIHLWILGFIFQTRKVTSIMIRVICESKNNPYHDNVGAKDTWSRPSAVTSKDGCVFRWSLISVVTSKDGSEFRLGQYRDDDHREDAPPLYNKDQPSPQRVLYPIIFLLQFQRWTKIQIFKRKFLKIS